MYHDTAGKGHYSHEYRRAFPTSLCFTVCDGGGCLKIHLGMRYYGHELSKVYVGKHMTMLAAAAIDHSMSREGNEVTIEP